MHFNIYTQSNRVSQNIIIRLRRLYRNNGRDNILQNLFNDVEAVFIILSQNINTHENEDRHHVVKKQALLQVKQHFLNLENMS